MKHDEAFSEVQSCITSILEPAGFTRNGNDWRHNSKEVLRQFSLVYSRTLKAYQCGWGLSLLSVRKEKRPPLHKLMVEWNLLGTVHDSNERLSYEYAFRFPSSGVASKLTVNSLSKWGEGKLDSASLFAKISELEAMSIDRRIFAVRQLFDKYVLPILGEVSSEKVIRIRSVRQTFPMTSVAKNIIE